MNHPRRLKRAKLIGASTEDGAVIVTFELQVGSPSMALGHIELPADMAQPFVNFIDQLQEYLAAARTAHTRRERARHLDRVVDMLRPRRGRRTYASRGDLTEAEKHYEYIEGGHSPEEADFRRKDGRPVKASTIKANHRKIRKVRALNPE